MVTKAAQLTHGSGGPSLLDADQYRHILLSQKFKREGKDLREQIASLAKKIATQMVDPSVLDAFTACRLIPLNKNPGVRPIGISEVLRRLIGKCIMFALKNDIQETVGTLQVAAGLKGGAEAAIHSMRDIYENDASDAVVLVDATNAFNMLNRQVALHNIQVLMPSFAIILINTYRHPSRLFITGGKELLSREGTTQGDNMAMAFYALGTAPLVQDLSVLVPDVKQVWLADDAVGAGRLAKLREWWDILVTHGIMFGFHVNESKSWLILKNADAIDEASELFQGTGLNITTSGRRHLGAALGNDDFRSSYVSEKVKGWSEEIEKLTEMAVSEPHAAFAAYIHGEQHRFSYFMRTIPGMEVYLKPLDDLINNKLLPAITGFALSEVDRELFSLPIRDGGLGVPILTEAASAQFVASQTMCAPLIALIIDQDTQVPDPASTRGVASHERQRKVVEAKRKMEATDAKLSPSTLRAVQQARGKGASNWLSVRPSREQGFVLNKANFHDAIALRYGKKVKSLPTTCPCGQAFSVTHAMNCKKGGFISVRHDEIRDFEAALLSKVCSDVATEPSLQPIANEQLPRGSVAGNDARLDVRARGFWRRGQNAFFDVRITNVDAQSQINQSVESVLAKHEREKKRQYGDRVMNVEHGTLTPLVFSFNGSMGSEYMQFHKCLASKIAMKSGQPYANVIRMIRCKISFLLLRAAILCLRGSRVTYHENLCAVGDDFSLYAVELGMDDDL